MTQELVANVGLNTANAQASMTGLANLTDAQMKRIAGFVRSANKELQDTKKFAADAANSGSYEKMAEGANKAASAHAGVTRELLVLTHEMSQGNFNRFGGSMLVLAERTNALEFALTAAGAATLAAGASFIGFAALVAMGAIETDKFNKSLIATNNFAGMTADSLASMSHQVAQATGGTIGNARAALEALTSSGKFGPNSIDIGAQAVVQMERVTGESADEIVKDFARMSDGVAKWAVEHNQSFHYLTATQYEYIKQLEDQGNAEQAEIENLKLLSAQFGKVNEDLGYGAQLWRAIKQAASDYADQVKSVGRPQTVGDQIDALDKQLARMKQARDNNDPTLLNTRGDLPATANNIAALEEQRRTLQRAQAGQQAAAIAQAQAGADQQAGIAARVAIDGLLGKAKATSVLTEALKKYHAEVDAANKAAADEGKPKPYSAEQVKVGEAQVRKDNTPGGDAQANEYANLQAKIKAYNATTEDERSSLGKLTEGQRLVIQIQEDMANSTDRMTAKQRAGIASDAAKAGALRDIVEASQVLQKSFMEDSDREVKRSGEVIAQQLKTAEEAQKAIDSFKRAGTNRVSDIDFQTSLVGKSPDDAARMQAQHSIDMAAASALEATKGEGLNDILAEQAKQRDAVTAALARQKAAQDDLTNSFSKGWDQASTNFVKQANDQAASAKKIFDDTFGGMSNAITKFAETGKLSISGLVNTIADDLIRMEVNSGLAALAGGNGGVGSFMALLGMAAGSFGGTTATATLASSLPGDSLDNFLSLNNNFLGSFANGLGYVPQDGLAYVHEGETITRKQDAAVQRSGGAPTIHIDQSGMSFGAGVDAAGVAQAVRTGMQQTKADIQRSLSTTGGIR